LTVSGDELGNSLERATRDVLAFVAGAGVEPPGQVATSISHAESF